MHCKNNNLGLNANSCNDGLRHIEQIALNKAGIDCLDGRMCRAEADIKDRYTKAELDWILARKMDRCGNIRPSCNSKPNICDYYTKDELDQILAEIACKCDTYSKEELDDLLDKIACTCDCYSKNEVDELLKGKADVAEPKFCALSINEDYQVVKTGRLTGYYKTHDNLIIGSIACEKLDGAALQNGEIVAILPAGDRPAEAVYLDVMLPIEAGAPSYPGHLRIDPDGSILVYASNLSDISLCNKIYGSFFFVAVR